jgi:predicted DNA binding CopG/RHH family protein
MKKINQKNHSLISKGSTKEIIDFLEDFRNLQTATKNKTKLISIKMPESLLNTFKYKCGIKDLKYQTQIKILMREWVLKKD